MADDSDDVTMTARLGSQNAKAILNIMVRDALDQAGKNFLRLFLGRAFHTFKQPRCRTNSQGWVSATVSLLRISAASRRSNTGGYALLLLCPLAHLPIASKQSTGIGQSYVTVV
jgi:hypothetical protein